MRPLVWSVTAREDLRRIRDHISIDSRTAARLMVNRIRTAAKRTPRYPKLGCVVPEFEREHVREPIVDSYRVIYVVGSDRVSVARVVHGAMDVRPLRIEGA